MRLPVTFALRPSVTLTAALFLIHGLAVIMVAVTDLHLVIKFALWIALAFSSWRSVLVHALHLDTRGLAAITLRSDGELEIEYRDGEFAKVLVDECTTVFSWLVVLLMRRDGRLLAVTLPNDTLGVNAQRQLRLWLRWVADARSRAR